MARALAAVRDESLGGSGVHPVAADGVGQAPPRLGAAAGASAELAGEAGAEVIRVRDNAGQLLFEHHPDSGRSVLYAPAGDLELRADHGSVTIAARDAVRLRAEREVELATPSLVATAARADVTLDEARLIARALRSTVDEARHVVGRLTLDARRIVERSQDVYREVAGLSQTRAGRMRHVVSAAFHLLADRAVLKTEEDLKLRGRKIHLG